MKKLLLTFLLVMLPLQFAQAAMCPYCCNDEIPFSTQQEDSDTPAISADDGGNSASATSHRCGFCNLSSAKFVTGQSTTVAITDVPVTFQHQAIKYQSFIPRGPERPNWMLFA